jgi:hypothetical protein
MAWKARQIAILCQEDAPGKELQPDNAKASVGRGVTYSIRSPLTSHHLRLHLMRKEPVPVTGRTQPTYWIIVGSPDNFARTAEYGFTVQGLKSRHRKKAERMKPGDKIVYYLTGRKAFGGIVTIESPYFESHERIWESGDPRKEAEDYPFRVNISPAIALPAADAIPAEPIARRMDYVAKWPAANWTLAFQGNVHEIGENDYRLIRDAIASAVPLGVGVAGG